VRHGASGGWWIGWLTLRIPRHARQRAARLCVILGLRASRSGASEEERRILSVPRMVPDERALERVGNRRGFGACGRATPQGETVRLKTIVRTYSLAGLPSGSEITLV
jgi:hypothetical protein